MPGRACKICEITLPFYSALAKAFKLECSAQVWVPQFKKDVVQLVFVQIESVQPGQTSRRPQLLRLGGGQRNCYCCLQTSRSIWEEKGEGEGEVICHLC